MFGMMYADDNMLLQNADIFVPDCTASRPRNTVFFYLGNTCFITATAVHIFVTVVIWVEVFKRTHVERI